MTPKDQTGGGTRAGARERAAVRGLLAAYARGYFPMAESAGGEIGWYDPDPRGIVPLTAGGLVVSRSLEQRVRSRRFEVTCDRAFGGVIRACAAARAGQDPSACWIDDRIVGAYEGLHAGGHAHSIEAWRDGELVGGLYGVHLRGLFAGESMFSVPGPGTDASKVCLVHLWHHLRSIGVMLLDTQFWTPHLGRLGCVEVSRERYRGRLERAMDVRLGWGSFDGARAKAAVGMHRHEVGRSENGNGDGG
jgi:leucyl/phenylalanyl-tRNA--protein transferase